MGDDRGGTERLFFSFSSARVSDRILTIGHFTINSQTIFDFCQSLPLSILAVKNESLGKESLRVRLPRTVQIQPLTR